MRDVFTSLYSEYHDNLKAQAKLMHEECLLTARFARENNAHKEWAMWMAFASDWRKRFMQS